jgi:hypothetical protein
MISIWNPAVVCLFDDVTQHAIRPELSNDASVVDVDSLLSRVVCALATQI